MRIIDLKQKKSSIPATVKPLAVPWMWNLIPAADGFLPSSSQAPENSAVFSEETANSVSPGNASVSRGRYYSCGNR